MDGHAGFEEFYVSTYGRLVSLLVPLAGGYAEAEELAQEAYVRAYAHWPRIADYDQPEAWLRRVAINLASSHRLRSRRRFAAHVRHGVPPPAPPASPDEIALVQALRTLPPRYREALSLHYLLDLSVSEIAADLGVPVSTVTSRLSRGRAALAAALAPRDREVVGGTSG